MRRSVPRGRPSRTADMVDPRPCRRSPPGSPDGHGRQTRHRLARHRPAPGGTAIMTSLSEVALTRPASAADRGPLDDELYDLVERRFRRLVREDPTLATANGIHTEDHRLGDGGRDAALQQIAADRAHLAAVEAVDAAGLS